MNSVMLVVYVVGVIITASFVYYKTEDETDVVATGLLSSLVGLLWPFLMPFLMPVAPILIYKIFFKKG